ncbi:DNA polymerase III, clamp loader complex, gamma/delta/delta subunit [Halteromyces radiatus]|uniref:DNA polymerase III, clamp loader complex, gamma/delta/delta subunit n=1 Tax=Halteromyces radiatus TaxID=101107 RepID=UPI002220CF21|nr:DNA polymerase III, clamp loader complex, gamma/delta/delta subunit [Halteromyces radiatus]KAI8092978.1 DNA polymerase III, clamp loader complex, gamma/delta/delta subunit [Halteromyces radiatus]
MQQVECPICGENVNANNINSHLDSNCSTPVIQSEGTVASLFTNPKAQKTSETDSQPKRIAPLFKSPTKSSTTEQQSSQKQQQKQSPSSSPTTTAVMTRQITDTAPTPSRKRQKLDAASASMPLAAKVRPISLDEFVGQDELVGKEGILRTLIESDRIPSMIFWGGPGCGKTTLARIISKTTKSRFVELSATSHGAADVKKAFDEAKGHLSLTGQRTIVFIDEIHRFTKVQQDLFLPYVEQGQIRLIGATTENPSFKVNAALLSRCRVFVLKQLTSDEITSILTNALRRWRLPDDIEENSDMEELDDKDQASEKEAISFLANFSDGDARNALNTMEIALSSLPSKKTVLKVETIKGAFQKSHLLYDRNGEEHYNIISALHKSIRGSDADAGLYWLGRMLEAGEDPLYIARRLVRCASEDIGLADNSALPLAVAGYQACERIGLPECNVILAQVVVYLAETKKSVRVYKAYKKVKEVIASEPNHPVPLHIRNAPTKLMKDIGYGHGYKYNPDYDEPVEQTYLPDALADRKFLEQD